MIKYACDCCGKEINIYPSELKYKKHLFCSKECKNKFHSINISGKNNPKWNSIEVKCEMCGKSIYTTEYRLSQNRGKYCSLQCYNKSISERIKGDKHPNWKGGITPLKNKFRNSKEYNSWRTNVFKRDNFTCQICGEKSKGNLHAHHIKSFSDIFVEISPKNINDLLYNKELMDISNGITLCEQCHYNLHWGNKQCRKSL